MPEAPVDKNDRPMLRQDEVGGAGEISPMQPEPKAEPVNRAPDNDFRLRVA